MRSRRRVVWILGVLGVLGVVGSLLVHGRGKPSHLPLPGGAPGNGQGTAVSEDTPHPEARFTVRRTEESGESGEMFLRVKIIDSVGQAVPDCGVALVEAGLLNVRSRLRTDVEGKGEFQLRDIDSGLLIADTDGGGWLCPFFDLSGSGVVEVVATLPGNGVPLRGSVIHRSLGPAVGVWVMLQKQGAGSIERGVFLVETDSKGAYHFEHVAPGRYSLGAIVPASMTPLRSVLPTRLVVGSDEPVEKDIVFDYEPDR